MATADKIKIAELEIDYKDVIKSQAELADGIRATKEDIADLVAQQKILREEGRAGTEQYERNAKAIEQSKVVLAGLTNEYKNNERILISSVAAQGDSLGTIQKLDARNKELRASLRELNLETDEGKKKQKQYIAEINKNTEFIRQNSDAAIQQKMNIGNYKSALDLLPGSMKNVANGFQMAGNAAKMLIANPVFLAITAIVGAIGLLVKAFKGTDEGALKMEMAMNAIKNVIDVVFDRITSFTKVLKDIVTFNWKDLKKHGEETFGGIKESIEGAVEAGKNYARVMDEIEEGMAADAVTRSKMRLEMEEQKQLMRDVTKSYAERQAAAQRAFDLEKKINEQDVEWKKRSTEAEIVNLASKLQNYNMTLEEKTQQVKEWLNLDAEQLKSAQETNAEMADFYNKNEEAFQKAQKALSEDIDMQTEFFANTKRLVTSLTGFNKELAEEQAKRADERKKQIDAENEALKQYYDSVVAAAEAEMLAEVELEKQKYAEKERLRLEDIEKQKQWDEDYATFRQEKALIDAENERIAREVAMNDRFQAELDNLAREQEAEIAAALKTGASVSLIVKKYAAIEKAIEYEKQQAKLAIIGSFAGSLAQLFGEETKLGKAAAITQTVINTYKGAMAAFAETPGGVIIKSAAAATAIATGVAAVRNIMKQGKGGGEGASISGVPGTGGGGPQLTGAPSATYVTNVSQPQTVLVLEEFQMVQGRQIQVKQAGEL